MKRQIVFFAPALCLLLQAQNPAVVPTGRLNDAWWAARHQSVLALVKSNPDTQLLLIGDSITNNYEKATLPDENFLPTWKQFYEPRKALNLGFSGDTTANVLWRLQHGEVDGLHPKVAMVMIGTNNTGHANQTVEQTEVGIDAVVAELEEKLPSTKILLLAILPSALSDAKTANDAAVNQYLADCYGDNQRVAYLDIGSIFYKNGALNTDMFYDPRLPFHGKALHPDTNGQRMMAEAIEPTLAKLMGDTPGMPLASMTDINTALIPVGRLEQDSYDWYGRHHAELELEKKIKPRVVMIGDSITHFWGGTPAGTVVNGAGVWAKFFGDAPVINMGFGWDRTQNVLWRLRQGEFEGLSPQWIVVNIGTNNLTGTSNSRANTPEEIAAGVEAVCAELHRRSPESHIALMGIFPRGAKPANPFRAPIQKTNSLLAEHYTGDQTVTFLDIGNQLLSSDGTLAKEIMPDGTHPSEAGYQVWADALAKAGVNLH